MRPHTLPRRPASSSLRPTIAAALALAGLAACTADDPELGIGRAELGERCVAIVGGVAGGVVDDTYVTSRRPRHSFDEQHLRAGPDGAGVAMTLVRADLAAIPAGARIERATVSLHQGTRNLAFNPLSAHRVTAPWAETTATWTGVGGAYQAVPEAITSAGGRGTRASFTITDLARAWLAGAVANHGIAVRAGEPIAFFDELAGPRRRPTFTVCYTTCSDGVRNGDEAGLDCGGALCGPCTVDADGDGADAALDCDDHDAAVHPGAAERCNAIDDDCDGAIDQGDPEGGAACATGNAACPAGVAHCVAGALVCDAATGAAEACNGQDDDCDGVIDDGDPGGMIDCRHTVSYNPLDPLEVGGWFYGYTSCVGGDVACLAVESIERCDGVDNDLDGAVDEDAVQCRDADGDESGDPLDQVRGCAPVPGYVLDCGDCNDADAAYGTVYPGTLECDPLASDPYADHDCDGILDRGERDCT